MSIGGLEIIDADGNATPIDVGGVVSTSTCPRCGQPAVAENRITVREDGMSLAGFGDTDADKAALLASLRELRALRDDATVEEVVAALERVDDPQLRPVVTWIRDHYSELVSTAGLGISVVSMIIAIVMFVRGPLYLDDPPPAPPPGISPEDLRQLLEEVRSGPTDGDGSAPGQN